MRKIHLLCNAHIDPVWQWEWEEGAAAAVSTFAAAADFCEEFDAFVFCHNEALLYKWVEEYRPPLFARIQRLVKRGKWRVMGGWLLQSDCNMPSGESFVRQIREGRAYFMEKFGVRPEVAVSFDAFGHTRGLVQILRLAGCKGYLFMRPDANWLELPANDFVWVGFDGQGIPAHRIDTGYNSPLGGARAKLEAWIAAHEDCEIGLMPWGVGNHGGGPSRKDIADLNAYRAEHPEIEIAHSDPETYFADVAASGRELPRVDKSLRPWAVGCYTSQIRVKQTHRAFENAMIQTERMLTHAAVECGLAYPARDIAEAAYDLCVSEFHDVLPGTCIQNVEETALRGMRHGLEILARLKARAFFALASGERKAAPGEIPVLVYNALPYEVERDVDCEFMLADQNWKTEFTRPRVYRDGAETPSQVEKENSNLNLDWRKRVVFRAKLAPMSIARFGCFMDTLPEKPVPTCPVIDGCYAVLTDEYEARVSISTGLLDKFAVGGVDYVLPGAAKPVVIKDNSDPWGMLVDRYRDQCGAFALVSEQESARFSGVQAKTLPAVRVIEAGEVRVVIEAVLAYENSRIVLQYVLPLRGHEIGVRARVLWAEKDRMLKLAFPTPFADACVGQTAFGCETLENDGREVVFQKWVVAADDARALTILNDGVYGGDFAGGEMRLSLLRGAAYTGHPIMDRPILPEDRFSARIDQGERLYEFRLSGGSRAERLSAVDREAEAFAEPPVALSFFPDGAGGVRAPMLSLSDDVVNATSLRRAADGDGWILRLFEPTGTARETEVRAPMLDIREKVALGAFEIVTLRLRQGSLTRADICD